MRSGERESVSRPPEERVSVAEGEVCLEIVEEGSRPEPDCLTGRPCSHGFLMGLRLGAVKA